ncbi:hypothetical protein ACJA28_02135 [Mesomycoplasma moatsii]|uniref:hypothetical protein n=1 Tax=Mesomycoplasma moatsii TaxID=171287 RepID=UPI0003B3E4EE
MKIKSEYELEIHKFFVNQEFFIRNKAIKIKKIHYSIPLEIDDLISFSYFKMLESENKLKYFELKNKNENIEIFFKSRVSAYMWTYCNIYKSKNHQILNNSITNENNDVELDSKTENYNYEEIFNFLTSEEFNVIYEIYVNKLKRKDIAKKLNISKIKLKQIENNARNKICKHFNILI